MMTKEGDVVLVHMDSNPAFFARVESIEPDVKAGWFHLRMLVLQTPLLEVTWILRRSYIDGDTFTMNNRPIRIDKVTAPEGSKQSGPTTDEALDLQDAEAAKAPLEPPAAGKEKKKEAEKGKVVSLFDRKNKNQPS